MILIVVLSSWVVFGLICYFATLPQKSLPVVPRPKSHPGIHDGYVSPNKKEIDELETVLGVGRDIVGLDDCHWVIMRGCEVTRFDAKVGDPDGLKIYLRDAHNKSLRSASVSSKVAMMSSGKRSYVNRTADAMDADVQKGMKILVKDEIESRQREGQLNNIIEKYNGKAVEV